MSDIVQRMKGMPEGGRGVRFPIRDAEMNVIGSMNTFDRYYLDDDALVGTMAATHTRFRENFLTQFEVTTENKRNWLEKSVLENESKALFLIEATDGRIVGQGGFTILSNEVFVLDGAMRWGRGGHRELFIRDGNERAAMCFFLLGCERCEIEIFSGNEIVIENTLSSGYVIKREYPLAVTDEGEKRVYRKIEDGECANTSETLYLLSMDREEFAKRHRNIIDEPCWKGVFSK